MQAKGIGGDMEPTTEQGFWPGRRGVVWFVRDTTAVQVHDTSSNHHAPTLDDERVAPRGQFVRVTPLGCMTDDMGVVP